MTTSFLLPEDFLSGDLPVSLSEDWSRFGGSAQGTIYATYLALAETGADVRVCAQPPEGGVVIAHPTTLASLGPGAFRRTFVVCWQQDYKRCDFAHVHIVMNSLQLSDMSLTLPDRLFWPGPSRVLHYVPELSLKPRSADRGTRFEVVGYFGARKNLLPEMQDERWERSLRELGLRFHIFDSGNACCDYSGVDAVVAVRPPLPETAQKSPHKLWNAWRAGVPAILGVEPGFRDYRKTDLDYFEVRSAEEAVRALRALRETPELREAMIDNGKKRATECSVEEICREWRSFLDVELPGFIAEWQQAGMLKRTAFRCVRGLRAVLRQGKTAMRGGPKSVPAK